MCRVSLSALKFADKKADLLVSNIAASQDPEATIKDALARTIVGKGQILGLQTSVVRKTDLLELGALRVATSSAEYATKLNDHINLIVQRIGSIEEGVRPTFAKEISEFVAATVMLANNPSDPNQKRICIDLANNIANIIRDTSNFCYERKFQIYQEITEEISNLNQNLSELASINKELKALPLNSDRSFLEDARDKIINNISSMIDLDAPQIGDFSAATISSRGYVLVDGAAGSCWQISSSSMSLNDVNAGHSIPSLYMRNNNFASFDITQQGPVECTSLFSSGSTSSGAGKILALYDLYNNQLASLIDSLDILAANVTQKMNAVHNSGSCTSGRSDITGTTTSFNSESKEWKGSFTLGLVDANGKNLKSSLGSSAYNIPPLKLNLEKLSTISENGSVSTKMIIDEINSHFNFANKTVVAMCPQSDNSSKHLMQDIAMVVSSNKNGIFKFDFSGFNNSDFDADLEILTVSGPTGTSVNGALPEKYSFTAGEKARTFQCVNLAKSSLTGSQNIDVKFRVKGTNGNFGEGILRFNINFDTAYDPCTRITGSLIGGASDGSFVSSAADTSSKIAAKLVRADGSAISTEEAGFFNITKNTTDTFGIVLQDDTSSTNVDLEGFSSVSRGFGHYYGMNNLFNITEQSKFYASSMRIRQDIFLDDALFSSGRLLSASPTQQVKVVGGAAASATVNFTAFGGGINIASYNGATLTIDSKTYTLVNSATTSVDEISILGLTSEQAIINAIVTYLNDDAYISNLVEFSSGADQLIMTSTIGGASSNAISYQFVSGGALVFNSAADTGALSFSGGTDLSKALYVETAALIMPSAYGKLYEDFANLDYASDFITSDSIKISAMGLSSYATNILDRLLYFKQTTENNMNVKVSTLKYLASDFREKFGFDASENAMEIANLVFFKTTLAQALSKIEEMNKAVLLALTR
ncbi:MAG: hypothetical protein SFT68_00080, partial [Rickettsiaceae bacterium]|nr:hypothetical protein [Rickettsiaceae bacterium]